MGQITELITNRYAAFVRLCEAISFSLVLLIARFAGAIDFWRSGQKKINGEGIGLDFWNGAEAAYRFKFNVFDITDRTYTLFGRNYGIPEPFVPTMTQAATIMEFLLPLLLVIGFASRFAALGLLGMTAFIQFYVFPEHLLSPDGSWIKHLLWLSPLLLILVKGPGKFSLDHMLGKRAS